MAGSGRYRRTRSPGFALFADLSTPQLESVAHTFEERWFPEGERVLRQGLTGSGLLRDPRGRAARSGSTARSAPRSVAATSSARCRSCSASRRSPTSSRSGRCAASSWPGPRSRPSWSAIPRVMYRMLQALGAPPPEREPVAELSERPFPPGDYPVVVVGSGPGGLQVSYSLRRLRRRPRRRSRPTTSPAGMFRRWPFFQRLLSWTKPYAPVPRGTRAYERYDWNSLLADDDAHRAIQARVHGRLVVLPVAAGDGGLARRVRRARPRSRVRYGCRWESTRAARRRPVRADDERRRVPPPTLVFAVGVAEPWSPTRRASSTSPTTPTPGRPRPTPTSACSSSASRTPASSWRPGCCRGRSRIVARLAAARPSCRSTPTRWSASGRATSSRTRTTSWAAASASSTPRSRRSSGRPTGRASSSGRGRRAAVRRWRSRPTR